MRKKHITQYQPAEPYVDVRRRRIIRAIVGGTIILPGGLALSAHADEYDVESTPSGDHARGSSPPDARAHAASSQAFYYPDDDGRLLTVVDEAKRQLSYNGAFVDPDLTSIETIDRVEYQDPVQPENSYLITIDDQAGTLDLKLNDGTSFNVKRAGDDFTFNLQAQAENGETTIYSSSLSKLRDIASSHSAPAPTRRSRRAGHLTIGPATGQTSKTIEVGPVEQGSSAHTGDFQEVLVRVTSGCSEMKTGVVSVDAVPDAALDIEVAHNLVKRPGATVSVPYRMDKDAFYARIPMSSLATDFEVVAEAGATSIFNKIKSAITDYWKEAAITVAAVVAIELLPEVALPVLLLANTRRVKAALKAAKTIAKVTGAAITVYQVGEDTFRAVLNPGKTFPIKITARYLSVSLPELSDLSASTVVQRPGQPPPARLSLRSGKQTDVKIIDVKKTPDPPRAKEDYVVTFAISCDDVSEYVVSASVEGTDGYTGSVSYPAALGPHFDLSVPGSAGEVKDVITINLTRHHVVANRVSLYVVFQ